MTTLGVVYDCRHEQLQKTCKSKYVVHEEFPYLRKTESNWLSNEWNKMKEALCKSLSTIQYVNRCSNKNGTLLTVRRVYRLKACQKHKNN